MTTRPEDLCGRAQAGDTAAAGDLLKSCYQSIFAYFRRLCGSDPDAEDLTQKTFGRVWTALPQFRRTSSFSTWVHGIAHHVYVDWRRKPNRTEPRTDEWWLSCRAEGPTPFESVAERDCARQLYALIDQLDPESREAVHLHYYQGLTLAETAGVLNVSPGTVKNRLREAVNFLRNETNALHLPTKQGSL